MAKLEFYNEETGLFVNQTKTIMERIDGGLVKDAYAAAAKVLSPAAFKMYACACLDADGWQRTWKHQDFDPWGVTQSSYYRGLQELKKLGFIDGNYFKPGAALYNIVEEVPKNENGTIPKNGNEIPTSGNGIPKNGNGKDWDF